VLPFDGDGFSLRNLMALFVEFHHETQRVANPLLLGIFSDSHNLSLELLSER